MSNNSSEIRNLFDRIASRYDLGNNLISFGTHHFYKRKAIENTSLSKGDRFLDLCTGTGDLIIQGAKVVGNEGNAVGADFSIEMLEVARKRIDESGLQNVEIVHADVTNLPFEENSFDVATMAFGLRNISEKEKVFKEVFRVLKRGGRLAVLEFSNPREFICPSIYRIYLNLFMPLIGGIASGDYKAYWYLASSVNQFPQSEMVSKIAEDCGFQVKMVRFLGGSISLYNCLKP